MPVVDIVLLSVIVLLVVVCCAIESDFVQRYRRKLACAIAGLAMPAAAAMAELLCRNCLRFIVEPPRLRLTPRPVLQSHAFRWSIRRPTS